MELISLWKEALLLTYLTMFSQQFKLSNKRGLTLLRESPRGAPSLLTQALQHWTNQLWECKNLHFSSKCSGKSLCLLGVPRDFSPPVVALQESHQTATHGEIKLCPCISAPVLSSSSPFPGSICASQLTAELIFYHHLARLKIAAAPWNWMLFPPLPPDPLWSWNVINKMR